jgi:hypothetical protein
MRSGLARTASELRCAMPGALLVFLFATFASIKP